MPPDEILYSPWILAVLGLCIGSFLNVVIHRLPLMLERGWREESAELLGVPVPESAPITLSTPRSRCPSCGHAIVWYENIPLASWLWLRGRCSACKTRISARYPLVEVATAALFAAIGWHFGAQPTTLLWCGFAAVLVAAAMRPAQRSGWVRMSGSNCVSKSISAAATSTAAKPHQRRVVGWAPKCQPMAANSAAVATSTRG